MRQGIDFSHFVCAFIDEVARRPATCLFTAEPPLDPDHVPPPAVDSTLYKTQWYYVERNRSGHVVSDRCVKLKEVTPSPELQLQTIGHSDRPDSVKVSEKFQTHF